MLQVMFSPRAVYGGLGGHGSTPAYRGWTGGTLHVLCAEPGLPTGGLKRTAVHSKVCVCPRKGL